MEQDKQNEILLAKWAPIYKSVTNVFSNLTKHRGCSVVFTVVSNFEHVKPPYIRQNKRHITLVMSVSDFAEFKDFAYWFMSQTSLTAGRAYQTFESHPGFIECTNKYLR